MVEKQYYHDTINSYQLETLLFSGITDFQNGFLANLTDHEGSFTYDIGIVEYAIQDNKIVTFTTRVFGKEGVLEADFPLKRFSVESLP